MYLTAVVVMLYQSESFLVRRSSRSCWKRGAGFIL